jgi:hypothetical protein
VDREDDGGEWMQTVAGEAAADAVDGIADAGYSNLISPLLSAAAAATINTGGGGGGSSRISENAEVKTYLRREVRRKRALVSKKKNSEVEPIKSNLDQTDARDHQNDDTARSCSCSNNSRQVQRGGHVLQKSVCERRLETENKVAGRI